MDRHRLLCVAIGVISFINLVVLILWTIVSTTHDHPTTVQFGPKPTAKHGHSTAQFRTKMIDEIQSLKQTIMDLHHKLDNKQHELIWWDQQNLNSQFKREIVSELHQKYLTEFDATQYDILAVHTGVGDECVRFSMYGPKGSNDTVTNQIRRTESWEASVNNHFQINPHCKEADDCGLFVDIGANLGYWSFFMAHLGYDVISFEAMTSNSLMMYATLQDLIEDSIQHKINIFPVALSNMDQNSTDFCRVCSYTINTQDGQLQCGQNPKCVN
eukprot:390313_1